MNIKIKYEKSDWKAFRKCLKGMISTPRRSLLDRIVPAIAFWMVMGIIATFYYEKVTMFHIPTAILSIVLMMAVFVSQSYRVKRRLKFYEPSENGDFLGEHEFQFEETSFKTISRSSECQYKWDVVLKIERAEGMIMLFVDSARAFILPENQLDNPDDIYQKLIEFSRAQN